MNYECTEDRFLADIKDHSINVIKDDGYHRHIRFAKPGTGDYRFDLITWPGHLCISGDFGTYVYKRLEDMFRFFRNEQSEIDKPMIINPGYWREKLKSPDSINGHSEFDRASFRARVTLHFEEYFEDTDNHEEKAECWAGIERQVLSPADDGEIYAYAAVSEFSHNDFYFQDFFDDGGTTKYTFRFIWCLFAIVYGIREYDKYKTGAQR